jgi:glycosyltransferase involved in cell wall biosynthesis
MNRPLRIWLPAIRAGSGADVFVQRLAQGLRLAGHEPLVEWFEHRYELMPWRLATMDAPEGIDVVHANSWQGFAFKRPGIPLVITEHQYIAHPDFVPWRSLPQALYHDLLCRRWLRRSYEAADAIVAVSEYCAKAMRADVDKPVAVIHNWVDTDCFTPAHADATHEIDSRKSAEPFKLLFVGNPSRWKGADLLPAIADRLGPGFQIRCIGGLRAGFNAAGLPGNVKSLPRMAPEQMPAVYRSVDAALVPTRYEAFGYVALEAMACGLPVVGFASSGTAEVCQHEKTALLAPVDDLYQLVRYAKQLAQNSSLCAQLGAAGRRRAVECFGEARAIAAYANVYRSVLDKGPAS